MSLRPRARPWIRLWIVRTDESRPDGSRCTIIKRNGSSQESVHVSVGVEGRKRLYIRHILESTSPSCWTTSSCQDERRLDGKSAALNE